MNEGSQRRLLRRPSLGGTRCHPPIQPRQNWSSSTSRLRPPETRTSKLLAIVVYPCLSFSSDDHHLSPSCLGTAMRFGTQNKFCHYRASFIGSCDCFLILVGVLVGAVSRYCHFWLRLFGPQQPWQILVRCVLVNTLQHHDTVDFAQDFETEDPQQLTV